MSQEDQARTPKHQLKVWAGFVKLDGAIPTLQALQQLLYGSSVSSADDADVIALFLTDLLLSNETVERLRHVLARALRRPEDYVLNEADRNLSIRHIPAALVKTSENGGRYVSMSVAVHRRNISSGFDPGSGGEIFSVFPAPVMLICKSPRKNLQEPSFKAVLAQFVSLRRDDRELDLVLLGANLDTQTKPRLAQLEALERFLELRKGSSPRCALMFGDFNHRCTAFEELRPFFSEQSPGKFFLCKDGVERLTAMLADPARRHELVDKDDLVFCGQDIGGRQCEPSKAGAKLRQLFSLHIDARSLEIPLPSYRRTPLDFYLSQRLGCRLRLEDVIVLSELDTAQAALGLERALADPAERYFGWRQRGRHPQRQILTDTGDDGEEKHSLRLGWPDGVGIFRGSSLQAQLDAWEIDDTILATEHLPMRSIITVKCPESPDLKVWVGFAKLGFKSPTPTVLHQLLYGSATASAEGADVIALYVSDLLLTASNLDSMRLMLKQALLSPGEYFINEEDPSLPIKHLPAQLIQSSERGGRYVSMSVAVHRRNLDALDAPRDDGSADTDCFLLPVQLSVASARSNELEQSRKTVLVQEVLLNRKGQRLGLILFGASLDWKEEPQLAQLQAMHRLLRGRMSSNSLFCGIMWGDLGRRLVAFNGLGPHTRRAAGAGAGAGAGAADVRASAMSRAEAALERSPALPMVSPRVREFADPSWEPMTTAASDFDLSMSPSPRREAEELLGDVELTESGVDLLVAMVADPGGRRELLLKDALVYAGHGIDGRRCDSSECGKLMRRMFSLHIDGVIDGRLQVPMPSYQLTPPDDFLSELLGCRLRLQDAALVRQLKDANLEHGLTSLESCYFGWNDKQRTVKPDASEGRGTEKRLNLQLGWLDGIGIYKGGSANAELLAWETEDKVLAFDHLPLRALVEVSL